MEAARIQLRISHTGKDVRFSALNLWQIQLLEEAKRSFRGLSLADRMSSREIETNLQATRLRIHSP
jgi:hypothetical protein